MTKELMKIKIGLLLCLILSELVMWFYLPKKIIAKEAEESYAPQGILASSYIANLYFERFERTLGVALPCHPVDGQSVDLCLTENIEAILEAIE